MAADLNSLIRLDDSHIKPAGKMFARAFQDDPLLVYFFPDAVQRRDISHHIFELRVNLGVTYGEVYASSPALEAVAVWLPYGEGDVTPWERDRFGADLLSSRLDSEACSRRQSFGEYASSLHRRCVPSPHWYLGLIGVDPTFQGRGYASALLRAMLARIDEEHLSCYLETFSEKNVAIYRHYGFEVAEKGLVPGSRVTMWAMLRESIK